MTDHKQRNSSNGFLVVNSSRQDSSSASISDSHSQPTRSGVNNHPSYPYPFQVGTVTQVYSSSPSSDIGTRGGPRKLASTGKRVSKKARGVLGKVRTFHRIAAAKMAHPTIKIDTNVQATKRGFPEDNDHGLGGLDEEERDHPGLDAGDTEDVPPFLCQSDEAINQKFENLEWEQALRFAHGMQSDDPSHRWALENEPDVKARNRYINVQAWANSRIHLKVPEGECDFINASPIVLKDSTTQTERKYIATQGPRLDHLSHFWHMVFHESHEVAVVVMLTQTVEAGREKCAQYFPIDPEYPSMDLYVDEPDPYVSDEEHEEPEENILGEVTLLETNFDEKARSEIRKLELRVGSQSKIVWHFLFGAWADHSKPEGEDREALLKLIELSGSKCDPDNPRVVHCSAGVGRTGTFIALDHLLQELGSGQLLTISDPMVDPVYETVDLMRQQRMMMVYNVTQLQFIYEVLREQTNIKLGKTIESPESRGDERSTKMAKLSNESDCESSSKHELQQSTDRASSLSRSWSGSSEASDDKRSA